jgi:hypothetical protein
LIRSLFLLLYIGSHIIIPDPDTLVKTVVKGRRMQSKASDAPSKEAETVAKRGNQLIRILLHIVIHIVIHKVCQERIHFI